MLRERFSRPLDPAALAFSASTREDAALLPADLWGSIAHARMLGAVGLIPLSAARRLERGLAALARDAARGRFPLDPALEDVHLNVETELGRRVGRDAERLHTGRSRNDQVATDLAIYLRDALLALEGATGRVAASLLAAARGPDGRGVVDGWTHLQPAQRLTWAQWLGTHALVFVRDAERFAEVRRSIVACPLGSGAIAGSSLPLDRWRTARALGFAAPSLSSLDAVSDRDAAHETMAALARLAVHVSRLAEELVLGSIPEVGRVRLPEGFVTTSSLMPHKRNPDLAELLRAESAEAIGRLTSHLTIARALPLGYQRDLQAGKPIVFAGVDRALAGLDVLERLLGGTRFLEPAPSPTGATASVELADALVRAGVPFRGAHRRVARWLAAREASGRGLADATTADLRAAFPELPRGFRLPDPRAEPERRTTFGGSARAEVQRLLRATEGRLAAVERSAGRERMRLRRLRAACGLGETWVPRAAEGATRRRGSRRSSANPGGRRRPRSRSR